MKVHERDLHRGQVVKILPETGTGMVTVLPGMLAVTMGKSGKTGRRLAVCNGDYFVLQGVVELVEQNGHKN